MASSEVSARIKSPLEMTALFSEGIRIIPNFYACHHVAGLQQSTEVLAGVGTRSVRGLAARLTTLWHGN
jgi:hypothetical protein